MLVKAVKNNYLTEKLSKIKLAKHYDMWKNTLVAKENFVENIIDLIVRKYIMNDSYVCKGGSGGYDKTIAKGC